jgi:hypothetical protein
MSDEQVEAAPQVECCGNCRFFNRNKTGNLKRGICRENPGQVFAFPAQRVNPVTQQLQVITNPENGEPVFNTIGFQVPQNEAGWCGRHAWPATMVSAFLDDRLAAPAEGAA